MAEPRDSDVGRLRKANESLTRELLTAYEELDLLHTLSSIFATSADVDEMGERVVAEAIEALDGTAGFLVFTGEGMEEFDPVLQGTEADEVQAFVRVLAPRILAGEAILLDHAVAEGFEPRPLLAVPLRSRDGVFGVLGLLKDQGGEPFTAGDQRTVTVLATQASSVILQKRNLDLTFLSESLKRFNEGLRTLLEISRELTATLDVDRVLAAMVNLPGKVVAYDRAAIALKERARWRLRAVSGAAKVDRSNPEMKELESLLAWVGERGEGVRIESGAEGEIKVEREEGRELFEQHFRRSGMASFFSMMLADEEGTLGVLAVERSSALCPSERAQELLSVLANQATVALRNAQLYQQVPLIGLLEPVLRGGKRFIGLPRGRRLLWAGAAFALVAALLLVPAPLRVGGQTSLVPVRTFNVSAAVPGRVISVAVRDGVEVERDELVARLDEREYRLRLGEASAKAIEAERRVRQLEAAENPRAAAVERARRERMRAELAVAEAALSETALRAPERGVILTPRVRELVGRRLEPGEVFCTLAALDPLEAELSIPESDLPFLRVTMAAEIKLNAFPDRTFHGEVTAIRPAAEEREGRTVVVARVRLDNPDGLLKPGMRGRGRILSDTIRLGYFLVRRPARWVRSWIWF